MATDKQYCTAYNALIDVGEDELVNSNIDLLYLLVLPNSCTGHTKVLLETYTIKPCGNISNDHWRPERVCFAFTSLLISLRDRLQ